MKRRLIYGLLDCLFVCAGGMVGYGQEYYLHNLFANRVGTFEKKSASDYVFELDGTVHFYNGFYVANGADNNPQYIDLDGVTSLNVATSGHWENGGNGSGKAYTTGVQNPTGYLIYNSTENTLKYQTDPPTFGASLSITLPNKKLHQNDIFDLKPAVVLSNVPDTYTIEYEWYDDAPMKIGASETLRVTTTDLGSTRYHLVTKLKDENGAIVQSYDNYSTIQVFDAGTPLYPACYNVDRWVDGSYYDTYSLCTNEDGDISINLNDDTDNFLFITKSEYNTKKGYNPTSTITLNNGAKVCCQNVSFYFNEAILCNNFTFNGASVAGNQDVKFSFVNNAVIDCSTMSITQNKDQKKNYFSFSCESTVYASESIYVDSYNTDNMVIYGKMISPKIQLKNGNNTSINVHGCALIKTEDLTLTQSHDNKVIVQGHVIADNIQSEADIKLEYNGTSENNAIITVGSVNSNVIVIGGEHTVVNLCENPNSNTPDALGYFGGAVIYNTNSDRGWPGSTTPVTEGDINYNDESSNYYTYKTQGLFETLKLIAGYASYDDCMNEVNMAALLPIELVSFSFDKCGNTFVWKTASENNNDYFVVEYSKNGKDWIECTGHVSSMSTNGYRYETRPMIAVNESLFSYFRLKQVDYNGECSYSNVITVSFSVENPCSEEYKDTKIQLRELGGKWFRYINGELIYCENDN